MAGLLSSLPPDSDSAAAVPVSTWALPLLSPGPATRADTTTPPLESLLWTLCRVLDTPDTFVDALDTIVDILYTTVDTLDTTVDILDTTVDKVYKVLDILDTTVDTAVYRVLDILDIFVDTDDTESWTIWTWKGLIRETMEKQIDVQRHRHLVLFISLTQPKFGQTQLHSGLEWSQCKVTSSHLLIKSPSHVMSPCLWAVLVFARPSQLETRGCNVK